MGTKINDLGYTHNLKAKTHSYGKKSFYGAHQKDLNESRLTLPAAKCSSMILVSRSIRYADIRWDSWAVASNESEVVDDNSF